MRGATSWEKFRSWPVSADSSAISVSTSGLWLQCTTCNNVFFFGFEACKQPFRKKTVIKYCKDLFDAVNAILRYFKT